MNVHFQLFILVYSIAPALSVFISARTWGNDVSHWKTGIREFAILSLPPLTAELSTIRV